MPRVTFDEKQCKGCALCQNACPKKIIAKTDKVNEKGYHVYGCVDQSKCIGCAFCAVMCPDSVITVEK